MSLLKRRKKRLESSVKCPEEEQKETLSKYETAKKIAANLEKSRYDEIMFVANHWLNGNYGQTTEEKTDILDYLIDVLLVELCACGAVDPLINSRSILYRNGLRAPFPIEYPDQDGQWVKVYGEQTMEVELAKTKIYVHPWCNKRTVDVLALLKNSDFIYDKKNHISYYFTDLDFCYVYNGNHSINMGHYMKKGTIMSRICDTELLYRKIRTDGVKWYLRENNSIIRSDVEDYRLAAIFTFGQMRYELKRKEK